MALDMFFSGYRPLFLMDHFGADEKAKTKSNAVEDTKEYMPWDVSVSGLALNPDMKKIPRPIVRNLVPFQPSPLSEQEAIDLEAARFRKKLENGGFSGTNKNGGGGGVKVMSFEINNSNKDSNRSSSTFRKNSDSHNGSDNVTEFSIVVDDDFAAHPDVTRSLNRIKNMLLDSSDISSGPHIVYSPVSLSFGRYVHATSVKRKRKLKMNKHKLRKRRKLQRSTRRKLKR